MISRGFSGCHLQSLACWGAVYTARVSKSFGRLCCLKAQLVPRASDHCQLRAMCQGSLLVTYCLTKDVRHGRLDRLMFSFTVKRGNSFPRSRYSASAGERSDHLARSHAGTQALRGGPPNLEWRWWEAVSN